jgi:hypothetical protein
MPAITLNLSDNFANLVTKFNQLSATIDSDLDFRNKISVTDTGGDGSLSYSSSTGIITYTGPSAAQVRAHISVVDSGGDGSLTYSSSTGIINYKGPSAIEVRAHFSEGEGIDISSGVISGEDATTTNKGIASFDSSGFSIASGAVSIKTSGVTETKIADDAVSRAKLKDEVSLIIYDNTGSALKTLYGAGS